MTKKTKKPSYLNYHWGEALYSKQHGAVRFLCWADAEETKAEVASVDGLRPLPGLVPAAELSRVEMAPPPETFADLAGADFHAACDEARELLRKS